MFAKTQDALAQLLHSHSLPHNQPSKQITQTGNPLSIYPYSNYVGATSSPVDLLGKIERWRVPSDVRAMDLVLNHVFTQTDQFFKATRSHQFGLQAVTTRPENYGTVRNSSLITALNSSGYHDCNFASKVLSSPLWVLPSLRSRNRPGLENVSIELTDFFLCTGG